MLSAAEGSLFSSLRQTLVASRHETTKLNQYYEGLHRLESLGLAIPDEIKRFTVCVNWPRTTVEAVANRLDVVGFRMPGTDSADEYLWDVWQYNNMDERQTFVHTESLALARSYVAVGTNDLDPEYPLITVESPMEMVAVRDPRTHRVSSALRMYAGPDGEDTRATLYLPNKTRWLRFDDGDWVDEFEPDEHNLGAVPIVPFVNRARPTRQKADSVLEGVSEMADVIPISDSASRALTNAQLAQETHAVPARGVLGATKGDFVDQNGNPLPAWQAYFSSVWALGNKDAKTFQFDASDMRNFETMINLYGRLAASVTSLSPDTFGLSSNNPPSAEGYRAGETPAVKNAERKQSAFGAPWESVQRLVMRFKTGEWSADARRMETLWRDAGTPTVSQMTDAIAKRYQAGLIDWTSAQEKLGESPETIRRMQERRQSDMQSALNVGVQSFLDN